VDVHNNLGDLWRAQGAAGRVAAQRCYAEALRRNAQHAPAWRGLGDLYREFGDHPQAVACYQASKFCHSSFVYACVARKGLATTPARRLLPGARPYLLFASAALRYCCGYQQCCPHTACLELEHPVEACKQQQHRSSAGVPIECFPADAGGCRNRARMACEDASRPDARLHIWIDVSNCHM